MPERRSPATNTASTLTLHHEFSGDTASIGDARDAVAQWLRDAGATASDIDRATLLTSELTSNAIEASPDTAGIVRGAELPGRRVALSVTNFEPTTDVPPRAEWGPSEVLSVQGRGLTIVAALSDTVDVQATEPNGVTVTATMLLDEPDDA